MARVSVAAADSRRTGHADVAVAGDRDLVAISYDDRDGRRDCDRVRDHDDGHRPNLGVCPSLSWLAGSDYRFVYVFYIRFTFGAVICKCAVFTFLSNTLIFSYVHCTLQITG